MTCTDSTYGIKLTYYNNTISSGGYYLIANTHTFTVAGTQVNADAVYTDDANTYCSRAPTGFNPTTYNWNISATPKVKMLFNPGHNGSFWLTDQSGALIDAVGWTHDGSPPKCEGTCVTTPSGNGLQIPEQLIRFASTAGVSGVWGPAYDSSNNTVDFSTSAVPVVRAHNTSTAVATIVAGKVPFGAVISATDTLSSPVTATSMGSPPYAFFSLVPVATGTWSVFIASRGYECQLDTVTLSATGSIYQFPSTSTFLNQTSTVGFITGRVTDAAGVALSGVPVNPGGAGAIAATNNAGGYILRVSPGSVDVFANQSGDPGYSSSYVAQSSVGVSVSLGVVTSGVNFMLSQGGRVTGFVTRDGTNPLPGKAMALFDSNGQSHDQAVSDSNGRFTMSASTGNYTVVGEVDSLESVSPSSCPVTIPTGATVWSATFTVSGALGYITGHVYTGSNPISSGVLILASTQTLSIPPPALSTATLTSASIYATSSQEDGSYSVGVRQSTNPAYRVSACYFTVSSSGAVSISAKVVTGRQVYAGQIDTGVDFTW
ncbi:MAG: hypothetical protein NTX64_05240 [Elusimicrobia bacterium]|nr:hypothetical protein [Elusimicrobiota bacterium]